MHRRHLLLLTPAVVALLLARSLSGAQPVTPAALTVAGAVKTMVWVERLAPEGTVTGALNRSPPLLARVLLKLPSLLKSIQAFKFAAAPELLEALEWAVDNPHDDAYWISQARAAIAKAKGETK